MGRLHAATARFCEDVHAGRVPNANVQEDRAHQLGRQSLDLHVPPLRLANHRQAIEDRELGRADATYAEAAASVDHDPEASRVAGKEEEQASTDCLQGAPQQGPQGRRRRWAWAS